MESKILYKIWEYSLNFTPMIKFNLRVTWFIKKTWGITYGSSYIIEVDYKNCLFKKFNLRVFGCECHLGTL